MIPDAMTPLMTQYWSIKARHQNAILFFRMGDFYEMFHEDAIVASKALGLTLTSRNNGSAAEVPLAGVPVRAAEEYVRRLLQQGHRVAICEQMEDPKLAKGIVRRQVIETLTPGAIYTEDLLQFNRNNFLCAIQVSHGLAAMAAADISTGEFRLVSVTEGDAKAALERLAPRELVVCGTDAAALALCKTMSVLTTLRVRWDFDPSNATRLLLEQFGVLALDGLGIGDAGTLAIGSAGALLTYLRELQPGGLPQLARPSVERSGGVMPLDEMTRRNLELVESLRTGDESGTLLSVLDRTKTPMGARLLRQWILSPLTSSEMINRRLDAVTAFALDPKACRALRDGLEGVRDVERLAGRTATGRATPRDLLSLGESLACLTTLREVLNGITTAGTLADTVEEWDSCEELAAAIRKTLVSRPAVSIGEGDTIAPCVDAELDELRRVAIGGKDAIAMLQASERARTGIASLKVSYNKVFGYYIEVSNANASLVPPDYQRRQTLTGAERYVTPALKEFEDRVLHAAERIEALEQRLFEALRAETGSAIGRIQGASRAFAQLDALCSLADVAVSEGYVRPEMSDDSVLEIIAGRHPVVERMMARDQFIPNDVHLSDEARMIILTGPNMAGKSTILRQIGLIVLMAQMGSFVPAARARVGVSDRVFTRVGASDSLVRGQSTFMVEMSETSAILHTATSRSLVLLDEIGRGTSTWDGISIAWAVSEHLLERTRCKTVFATHYHELTQLADQFASVRNYNVLVKEVGDQIAFLHRLEIGGADRSYGIEVGRLAGLPQPVIARARELLLILEGEQLAMGVSDGSGLSPGNESADQLVLFGHGISRPVVARLQKIDPERTTPLEALAILAELVAEAKREPTG